MASAGAAPASTGAAPAVGATGAAVGAAGTAPSVGPSTGTRQWGLQDMPQQASPTQDRRSLVSEEPIQAQLNFFGGYQGPNARQEHYSCPPHSTQPVDGQHSSSPEQLFPAFAGQAAPQQAVPNALPASDGSGPPSDSDDSDSTSDSSSDSSSGSRETLQAARGGRRKSRSPRPSRG